jgi:hypothetical protein
VTVGGRPTRATVEGCAYLDLQNLARRQNRPTAEMHQLHALEGFLDRLASSECADRLVLEGGVLLAANGTRSPTRDVDMQARAIGGEREAVLSLVKEIAAVPAGDGLAFDIDAANAEIIRGRLPARRPSPRRWRRVAACTDRSGRLPASRAVVPG